MSEVTIFDKIVQKKIPANIVYEDELVKILMQNKIISLL